MCTLCQCTYCSRQEEGIRIVQLVLDYHDDRDQKINGIANFTLKVTSLTFEPNLPPEMTRSVSNKLKG